MEMKDHMTKKTQYIFVTGGVLSGVGKGITAASIGTVLQAKGLSVSVQKCDPYLNVDAGLLNPAEHGECFVTKDGAETDLDLGHYERFLDQEFTQKNATLSGRLMRDLIADERAGKFGGKTIQLVPHLTNAIQESIFEASQGSDVHIVEIGGTVGDYEGLAFIEAIREFGRKVGTENSLYLHVVYVPFISTSKEFKSKPAQNALNDLRGFGIVPDAVIVRSDDPAPDSVRSKVAMFGGVSEDNVLMMPNVSSVFLIPERIATSSIMPLLERFTNNTVRPDVTGPIDIVGTPNRWFDIAPFVVPVGRFGNLGRNVVIGPGFNNTDFSVIKRTKLTETQLIEFRWEVFDAFNHANFGQPGRVVGTANFGQITNTRFATGDSGSSRQMQFALKYKF